jgi:two-component system, NarL family, sensor histidine kinase UhpB
MINTATYVEELQAEKRELELALKQSEARFRRFMDAMPDACVILDRKLDFLYINRAAEAFSGLSLESIKGKPISILPAGAVEDRRRLLLEVISTGESALIDDVRLGGSFDPRRFRFHVFKIGEGAGVIWKDISDEKVVEAKYAAAQAELRSLAAHLLQVREDERKRVAREIHDELGQALTAIDMGLRWISHGDRQPAPEVKARIESMLGQSAEAIELVRRIASELRPSILDQLGLRAAMEWYVRDFSQGTGIPVDLAIGIDDGVIGEKSSTALFRITQEALTNVARYASASAVGVSLRSAGDAIELEVWDDGVGIDADRAADPKAFGLLGMRERIVELGGSLSIAGQAGAGTRILASIPLSGRGGLP